MEDGDIVQLEDLATVRAITSNSARRTLLIAAFSGPAAGLLALGLVFALYGSERLAVAYLMVGLFCLLGIAQFVHWFRHYRSITRQLDAVERRVKSGERVYGSQVGFHSYR
jgi:hypothetical protein